MNNGKVRIYELSRELNLDNKDLLAVCEQLSISVKSHSSTITDSEAELIRTAAEKYTANRPSPPKSAPSRNGANSQAAEAKAKAAAPVQKKQQILEIRKPIIRQAPSPEPPQQPSPSVPQPVAIDLPGMPPNPAPPRPVGPSRPAHPAMAKAPAVDVAVSPEHAIPSSEPLPDEPTEDLDDSNTELGSNTELESVQEAPTAVPEAPVEAAPAVASSSPDISQPELSGPPARPAPPSASINAQRVNLTNRPLLKRARSEQVPQTFDEPVELAGRIDSPERDSSPPRMPAKPAPAAPVNRAPGPVRPTDPRSAPKPQTIVELRRPPRPVRPGEGSVESSRPTEGVVLRVNRPNAPSASAPTAPGETASPDALLQARPTLPRAKKTKSW